MTLKVVLLLASGVSILWYRKIDNRLPWTVLWVLTSIFLSRVYWITAAGTLRVEYLSFLALFAHFFIDLLRRRKWPRFDRLPLLFIALLPWMVLGSLYVSPFSAASLRKTLIYFPYLGGFVALYYFLDSREKLSSAWNFLIRFGTGMIAFSLAGYFLFLAGVDLGMVRVEGGVIWLRGSLVNPNIFGAAAGILLISTLARFLSSTKSSGRRYLFDIGALIISSASLLVSFSRAVWILAALAVVGLFWYTRSNRKMWLHAFFFFFLSVSITSAIAVIGSKAYNSRMNFSSTAAGISINAPKSSTTGEFGEPVKDHFFNMVSRATVPTSTPFQQRFFYNYSSFRWRFSISIRALRDWLKSPILGCGTDSLMLSHPEIPQFYIPVTGVVILHDWGIIAFALYAAFLILTGLGLCKRLFLLQPSDGFSLGIFFLFLYQTLQSQISTTMQLGSFWVLAAIFAAAGKKVHSGPARGDRPLRVGFDAKWFFSDTSSSRVMVRNTLHELISRNSNMELFIFLRRCDRHLDFPYHGPGIHPVYITGRPNLLANLVMVPWKMWRLGLDVGIFQYFSPPYGRCRRIVIIHDIIFTEHPEYFSLLERLYFSPMRWLARRTHVICTISRAEKARLIRHGYGNLENIVVLYPGVSSRFRPLEEIPFSRHEAVKASLGLPPRFLLYLGRLNVRKNIINTLKAVTLLKDREICLVLAGESQGKGEDINAEIKRLHLEERVIRLGFVSDDDLPVLISLATLFCYVSHDEGFGLPVLEAMACGVAVVVSRKEVLQEICGPAGNYIDPQDPSAIATEIDRLLEQPEIRNKKSELGLAQYRRFSWEHSAETLFALCQPQGRNEPEPTPSA